MQQAKWNFLAISAGVAHISAIVTGAWTFSGSDGAANISDGLHFLSPAVSGEVSPEAFIDRVFELLPKALSISRFEPAPAR